MGWKPTEFLQGQTLPLGRQLGRGHRPTGLVNRAIPISIDHPDGRVRGDESAAAI